MAKVELDKVELRNKPVRSYVIREGRMTAGQKKALEQHWNDYGLNPSNGVIDPAACFENGKHLCRQVVIEIGFGMGDSLFETARLNPDKGYIGIETHRPGVGHLLQLASAAGLTNLRVFMADAVEVLSKHIPPGAIDVIQVFFPDPWPKKRHHKRRLVNSAFVELVVSRLKTGGKLHMATDWSDYADSIKDAVKSNSYIKSCDPEERVNTKYENRGKALGHEIVDMAYIRVK